MFSFLYSEKKKMRQNAENWLEVADRVYKFRRDQLTEAQNTKLVSAMGELKKRLKARADASQIRPAIESLEGVLQTTGGRLYPVSSLVENVEFFLVAAIVILGLRAYFVQPFKIPTNSMWPTYYGMTAEVHPAGSEPGMVARAARLATLGASHYTVKAPADGEVLFPVYNDGTPAISERAGRTLFIFPAMLREFTFSVGGQPVKVEVPAEFDSEGGWLRDAFFPTYPGNFYSALRETARKAGSLESSTLTLQSGSNRGEARVFWVPLGKHVKRGETIMSFDILTGDLLFVDRFTYNFFPPKVGAGFVFKTENIHSPNMLDRDRNQIRQYYIKRLVGTPGDTLEVRPPVLWRNGQPIDGAAAFQRNAQQEGFYPGYSYANRLYGVEFLTGPGETLKVPENFFFAMGDNSPKSQDSRFWGFVPEKDVVGRPLFIYYPLTSRWGPAK